MFDYTLQFDKFALSAENIRVTKEEIAEAYAQMDENLIDVIRQSAENIRAFTRSSFVTAGSMPSPTVRS